MLKSKRRIKDLKLEEGVLTKEQANRLTQIIHHFGFYIKQFELNDVQLPENIIDLLNSMPKLKKIILFAVHQSVPKIDVETNPLNLTKLEEIQAECYDEMTLNIFKNLTPGVLKKVIINHLLNDNDFYEVSYRYVSKNPDMKVFPNQFNIKEMMIDNIFSEFIDINQMKLLSLEIHRLPYNEIKLEKVLKSQHELKSLTINNFNYGDMAIISNELRSLEVLFAEAPVEPISDYAQLSKLTKLSKLKFNFEKKIKNDEFNEALSFMKSGSLTELELQCCNMFNLFPTNSTLLQLQINLPQLKKLTLDTLAPVNSINLIVQHLQIEELFFQANLNRNQFVLQEGLTNEKLKKLTVKIPSYRCGFSKRISLDSLPTLAGACKKLESFIILAYMKNTQKFNKGLKEHGGHLSYVSYGECNNPLKQLVRRYFSRQFSTIEWDSKGYLVMKK